MSVTPTVPPEIANDKVKTPNLLGTTKPYGGLPLSQLNLHTDNYKGAGPWPECGGLHGEIEALPWGRD